MKTIQQQNEQKRSRKTPAFLGVDVGSISTKAVIIDDTGAILGEKYDYTEGDPVEAVKRIIRNLRGQIDEKNVEIFAVGTTGSARNLIGAMLGAAVVKNEITAHAIGTLSVFPDVRTIFEIGGQDSKIILLNGGVVVDYAMNTLCAAGTGSFLSSQAKRLGIEVAELGKIALSSKKPTKIAARCTVFAESDLVHKAQIGHKKEDIVAGLCLAVVTNYLNNVAKGKKVASPIVFQGGVSKNDGVIRAFEQVTGEAIRVDKNGHLMGALGAAILAKNSRHRSLFDFDIANCDFLTKSHECHGCANNCEIIRFYRGSELLDTWGNRCERGG